MSGNPITPLVQMRKCRGCPLRFPAPHPKGWHPAFHSPACERAYRRAQRPKPPQVPRAQLVTRAPAVPVRRSFTPASVEQRDAVRHRSCLVDASHRGIEPAHLIPRRMLVEGQEDPRAVVPLCPACHRLFDSGELDLLPYLEPAFRVELAFAVERFGLISTLRRVTNERTDHQSRPEGST